MRQIISLVSVLFWGVTVSSAAIAKDREEVFTFGPYSDGTCAIENCGGHTIPAVTQTVVAPHAKQICEGLGLKHKGQAIITLATGRGNGVYYYTYIVSCSKFRR